MGDLDDGFGKGLWRFLRQIVPDAALDGPVLVSAREFLGIGTRIRVRRAVCVTFHGDRGHSDDRTCSKPFFQIVILRLAFSQCLPPAIIVDDDGDVVGVLEGLRAAIEGGVIKVSILAKPVAK